MRIARPKLIGEGTYYHLMNRICGNPHNYPFDEVVREKFVSILMQMADFYTVEPFCYQIMGNHYHIVLYAPAEAPSLEEAAQRFEARYNGKKRIDTKEPRCAKIAARMNDISWFMRECQQQFAQWFNKETKRRGHLWADRFKSVILEGDTAVLACVKYLELNPVRAGLVQHAADWRHCTWGAWMGSGTHPFAANLLKHVKIAIGERADNWSMEDVRIELASELARITTDEAGGTTDQIEQAVKEAAQTPGLLTQLDRRVRYWSDGMVIGSKLFVQRVVATTLKLNKEATSRHRLGHLPSTATKTAPVFYSWRRLRPVDS